MKGYYKATFSLSLLVVACVVWSQEASLQLLDGMELEYTYTDGGTVVLTFYDDKLRYRWTTGPFAGTEVADRVYQSREIGDELSSKTWFTTPRLLGTELIKNYPYSIVPSSSALFTRGVRLGSAIGRTSP